MTATYNDDDLVYVDPQKRAVIGIVEWSKEGNPIKLEMESSDKLEQEPEEEEGKEKGKGTRRPSRKIKRYYPWGTYKSMKKLYRIEGKEKEVESYKTLDTAIDLAVNEPFWD